MKIDVYAMPFKKLEGEEIVGYSFDVVMSHEDGKKVPLGEYAVSRGNVITGTVDYSDEEQAVSLKRIKDIIIKSGLDSIVAGAMSPQQYFWKNDISFPPSCDLTGAFDRAKKLYDSSKVVRITKEDYDKMMEFSDMLDKSPEVDVREYDGVYGRDEFDLDRMLYDDEDSDNKWSVTK